MQESQQVVVCGCGHWGSQIIRNMAALSALYGVVDARAEVAAAAAQTYQVKALSFEEALADAAVRAVMLATPAATHFSLAMQAMQAGKDVFIEKPMAMQVAEAKQLAAFAKKHGRVLMVGHLLHYHPAYLALRAEVRAGRVGELSYIESRRLSFGQVRKEEDVLWSFAPHDLSMALDLAGAPVLGVNAQSTCVLTRGHADMADMEVVFENNVVARVRVSWLNPVKEHKLVVAGNKGYLVFDDGQPWENKLMYYPHRIEDGAAVKGEGVALALIACEPLREECAHFVACVKDRTQPRTGADEGIAVVQALELASMALGVQHMNKPYFVHATAVVDDDVYVGEGSKIWHYSHVLHGSRIGKNVVVGQNASIGPHVRVGDGCKIQNNVSLYEGVTLEEDVFCGPSCVFTNVKTPRAHVSRRGEFLETPVGKGATIGANATIICGNRIGAYAMVGAGAVVTKDVQPHALVVGNPARHVGWVSHSGEVLPESLLCPREGRQYRVNAQGELEEVSAARAHG